MKPQQSFLRYGVDPDFPLGITELPLDFEELLLMSDSDLLRVLHHTNLIRNTETARTILNIRCSNRMANKLAERGLE